MTSLVVVLFVALVSASSAGPIPQPTLNTPQDAPASFAVDIELTASSKLAQSQLENMKDATLTALNSGPQGPIYTHKSLKQFIYESQGR